MQIQLCLDGMLFQESMRAGGKDGSGHEELVTLRETMDGEHGEDRWESELI